MGYCSKAKEFFQRIKAFWNIKKWIFLTKSFFFSYYQKFKKTDLYTVLTFLFRRFEPSQFYPLYAHENLKILFRLSNNDFLTSSLKGKLKILASPSERIWFRIKNILLLGAYQSRVEKAVYFTFVSLLLGLDNPFDKQVLKQFLERKINLIKRARKKVKKINSKRWNDRHLDDHLYLYLENSLLQIRVIIQMEKAVLKAKEPEIVKDAKKAIKKGLYPVLSIHGLSGAYWMRGTNRQIAGIFKPFDEEIHAPNNPIGGNLQGALGLRKTRNGCRVGEAAHHEVAAFLIDSYFGFGIVPKTYYAQFTHSTFFSSREIRFKRTRDKTKYGSFQEFVSGFTAFNELDKSEYSSIPLDEYQLLVILDVIIGNCDRNAANFLIGDEKIAAIDHGLSFPDLPVVFSFWYWDYLPQGNEPLYRGMIDLLNHFPLEEISWKLRKKCFISLSSIERMRERIVLFTTAVNNGLVPAQIQELFTIENLYRIYQLNASLKAETEKIVQQYLQQAKNQTKD